MNSPQLNSIVELIAVVFCLEIGALFGAVYRRDARHREHLIFSLFNLFLAGMAALRLLMQAEAGSRFTALFAFQWQCVAACFAVATFAHFTYLVTNHHIQLYLPPRIVYSLAALMAIASFAHPVLHLAPIGAKPEAFDDLEIGPFFPEYAALVITCGLLPCFVLLSTLRKLPSDSTMSPPAERLANMETVAEADGPDLILLRRHLSLILRGTFALMVLNVVDIVWFVIPTTMDLPFSFGAIGMIALSFTIASALGKEVVRSEKRKIDLESNAQERLRSLSFAQHQLSNQIETISWPLKTAIRLFERGAEKEALKENVARAIDATVELQDTLNVMLNVARVEAGKELDLGGKVPVDIRALLESLCRRRAHLQSGHPNERCRVESDIPSSMVLVKATAIKQVFYNLIDNAFKYSPRDSLITVRVRVEEGALNVRVTDLGRGVPQEDTDRIFDEPFYRGAAGGEATPGTGLGLNMARRYVQAMGGRLWVESAGADRGSTFVVTLPYEPDEEERGI